jgi:Predicted membrane protein
MDINDAISLALRVGVLLSAAIILIGVALVFVHQGSNGFSLSQIATPNSRVNSSIFQPSEVMEGLSKLNGLDYVYLGLMVLIATPIIRVVLGIAQFVKEGNKLYTIITVIVLFNLMLAIFILPVILSKSP